MYNGREKREGIIPPLYDTTDGSRRLDLEYKVTAELSGGVLTFTPTERQKYTLSFTRGKAVAPPTKGKLINGATQDQ